MVDRVTPEQRSKIMGRIRGKDTTPELILRRALHCRGHRYRIHARGLPGRPDLLFPSKRVAIWVHGCFWHFHQHPNCPISKIPKSRTEYWIAKFDRNRARDARDQAMLTEMGWQTIVVWECELKPRARDDTIERISTMLRKLSA